MFEQVLTINAPLWLEEANIDSGCSVHLCCLNLTKHSNQTEEDKLTDGGDRVAKRHDAPGVSKEEATSMEKTRGKADDLL